MGQIGTMEKGLKTCPVLLQTVRLSPYGLTIIHMAGLFGWIGMPHAFQVLTRSLHALCSYIILGLCYWYVDNLMTVSPISSYLIDSSKVDESVQHLLGEGSIAKQKS